MCSVILNHVLAALCTHFEKICSASLALAPSTPQDLTVDVNISKLPGRDLSLRFLDVAAPSLAFSVYTHHAAWRFQTLNLVGKEPPSGHVPDLHRPDDALIWRPDV